MAAAWVTHTKLSRDDYLLSFNEDEIVPCLPSPPPPLRLFLSSASYTNTCKGVGRATVAAFSSGSLHK